MARFPKRSSSAPAIDRQDSRWRQQLLTTNANTSSNEGVQTATARNIAPDDTPSIETRTSRVIGPLGIGSMPRTSGSGSGSRDLYEGQGRQYHKQLKSGPDAEQQREWGRSLGEGVYYVEKILTRRTNADGSEQYLIKWLGYSHDFNTWEPRANVSAPLLRQFEAQNKSVQQVSPPPVAVAGNLPKMRIKQKVNDIYSSHLFDSTARAGNANPRQTAASESEAIRTSGTHRPRRASTCLASTSASASASTGRKETGQYENTADLNMTLDPFEGIAPLPLSPFTNTRRWSSSRSSTSSLGIEVPPSPGGSPAKRSRKGSSVSVADEYVKPTNNVNDVVSKASNGGGSPLHSITPGIGSRTRRSSTLIETDNQRDTTSKNGTRPSDISIAPDTGMSTPTRIVAEALIELRDSPPPKTPTETEFAILVSKPDMEEATELTEVSKDLSPIILKPLEEFEEITIQTIQTLENPVFEDLGVELLNAKTDTNETAAAVKVTEVEPPDTENVVPMTNRTNDVDAETQPGILVRYETGTFCPMTALTKNEIEGKELKKILANASGNNEIYFLVEFKDATDVSLVSAKVLNLAFPQEVIGYYNQMIRWSN